MKKLKLSLVYYLLSIMGFNVYLLLIYFLQYRDIATILLIVGLISNTLGGICLYKSREEALKEVWRHT